MSLAERTPPVEGQLQEFRHFAWLPRWVDNKRIWMQSWVEVYEFKTKMRNLDAYYGTGLGKAYVTEWPGWDKVREYVL